MNADYKEELNKLVQKKKKDIPTSYSEGSVANILTTLEYTPVYMASIATRFDDKTGIVPIIDGKRSFRETLIHLLNIEGLHYTTIYLAFLLDNPKIHPIHAERDFDRLRLFADFRISNGAFDLTSVPLDEI